MGCFGFASPFSTLPNITQLVRILHLNYKTTCFPWKNEGFGTTLATHSRDSPGGKAAHKTTQHLQAWTCMDRQESQRNCPDLRKTLGKTGFLSGEDRIRTTRKIPGKIEV
jgi:hypothetical protein